MEKTDALLRPALREDLPDFRPGDTVKVHVRVVEGGKERIQVFQGMVIRRQGSAIRETFTCRKISFNNVGVERTFAVHSPMIAKLEIVTDGDVRRAKLYYLRSRAATGGWFRRSSPSSRTPGPATSGSSRRRRLPRAACPKRPPASRVFSTR